MIRNPAVAGSFYYASPPMLMEQIQACTLESEKTEVNGIIVPHAGYMYSGKVAGAVYSRIKMPDTFIILGPNHTGWGSDFSLMHSGVWRTPLGDVKVNSDLASELLKNSRKIDADEYAHSKEHSIEVQLPFMQYYSLDFQIVPITIKHYAADENFLQSCIEVGYAIAKTVKSTNESIVIVASTDFTHYESSDVAKVNDSKAISAIKNLDPQALFKAVRENNISMCGYAAVAVTLEACRKLGCKEAELIEYSNSGDVTGDYNQVVGYGGLIVKK